MGSDHLETLLSMIGLLLREPAAPCANVHSS
jgi:hypothetical protein